MSDRVLPAPPEPITCPCGDLTTLVGPAQIREENRRHFRVKHRDCRGSKEG